MALFGKSKNARDAASPNVVTNNTEQGSVSAEKADVSHLESARTVQDAPYIDPMAEKRLLRKLDRRLVPLTMILCK